MTLATRKAVVTKTFTPILRPSATRAENVSGIITNFHFLPPFYSILIRFRLILEKSQSFSNHAGKRQCRNFETLDIISPGIWDEGIFLHKYNHFPLHSEWDMNLKVFVTKYNFSNTGEGLEIENDFNGITFKESYISWENCHVECWYHWLIDSIW